VTMSSEGAAAGPCNEDSVCPSGSRAQGLAGCDPLTHSCLCRLGFQLDNGVCVGTSPAALDNYQLSLIDPRDEIVL